MGLRALSAAWLALAAAGCRGGSDAGSDRGADVLPAVSHDDHVSVEGKAPPGVELTNPFQGDSASAAEGGKLFTAMNCDGCHGGGATGFIAPSLSDGRWKYGGSDGALYQSIYYGRSQGMPAYGGVLRRPIIWKLVTYLRSLPKPAAVPTQAW